MASKLLQAQWAFTRRVPYLLIRAHQLGFHATLGDAYRDPRCPYGSKSSRHKSRLAIDLNLFSSSGAYLTSSKAHRPIGEWWESIGGIWGGRFGDDPNTDEIEGWDGNHYEGPLNADDWADEFLSLVSRTTPDRLHDALDHWFQES